MNLMLSQPQIYISPAPRVTATFDPPVVRPDEEGFYRVVFNALEESIEWPGKLPAPPQLVLRPGAHGQILQMTGTNMEPRTSFNSRVRSSGLGTFTVPEFVVTVYGKPVTVPAATLQVVSEPPPNVRPAARLGLEFPVTNLVVGQAVSVRIVLPGLPGGQVQGLGAPQLSGQGFLVDLGGARQHIEMIQRGGRPTAGFIYETTLTPVSAGKLSVFAQGFTAGNQFSGSIVINGPAIIPGGPPQYTLLESDPVELNVRPLPTEGKLPGFTGAIGSLAIGPPKLGDERPARRRPRQAHGHSSPTRSDGPARPAARPAAAPGARLAGLRRERLTPPRNRSCAAALVAPQRPGPLAQARRARRRCHLQLHPHPAHRSRARYAAHPFQLLRSLRAAATSTLPSRPCL